MHIFTYNDLTGHTIYVIIDIKLGEIHHGKTSKLFEQQGYVETDTYFKV